MKKKDPIIVYLSGGLGNQMFQYALGRCLSVKHNVPLKLDTSLLCDQAPSPGFTLRQYDLDIFNIQATIAQRGEIPLLYRRFFSGKTMRIVEALRRKITKNPGREKHFHFDPAVLLLGPGAYLEGYWQSEKYFDEISGIIRQDFTLKNPLSEKSQALFEKIKNSNSVCLHVRRTDYVGNKFHEIVGKRYYDDAISHLLKSIAIDTVFVFSDDIDWCEKNMLFSVPAMFVGNEYAGEKAREHFALMSVCKHFIIPNSSFSWWAAWLGKDPQKQVIAPKQWFVDFTINMSDITPASWIRI